MRVCDRHNDRRAIERVHIVGDDSTFDLCSECKSALLAFVCAPAAEPRADEVRKSGEIVHRRRQKASATQQENSAPAE